MTQQTLDMLFQIANLSVVPFWALLIFLPRANITKIVAQNSIIFMALGALYVALFAYTLTGGEPISMSSLADLSAAMANPAVMLVGWVHYLAFDLFVGMWIARDAAPRGVPHLLVIPCLALTFLAGPTGALLYLLLRLRYGAHTNLTVTD